MGDLPISEKYRIRRSDPQNIVIEKFGVKRWRVISYHGNSASSLLSDVFNVMMPNMPVKVKSSMSS